MENNFVIILKNDKVSKRLSTSQFIIKENGSLWVENSGTIYPMLSLPEGADKKKYLKMLEKKEFDKVASCTMKVGEIINGGEIVMGDDWANHPVNKKIQAEEDRRREQEKKMVKIFLSTRGWGDYSNVEWRGDITRPNEEILEECKTALENGYDVDFPDQSDEELLKKIVEAREKWEGKEAAKKEAETAEQADIQHKIETGFCFNCESWCHGDCGNYSNDPVIKYKRELESARKEQSYGIHD